MPDYFALKTYQYSLPPELIAQFPCQPRDRSRLMIVERSSGHISECSFHELPNLVQPQDTLVFNDTQVIPARLIGVRPGGGKAELLLVRPLADETWEVMARPGKKLPPGTKIVFAPNFSATLLEILPDGMRRARFESDIAFLTALNQYGHMPLPPYIQREDRSEDQSQYQTIYATQPGAIAAPTAGLHFTQELLAQLAQAGIKQHYVTLHVGVGTFKPVQVEDIRRHLMHLERGYISQETAVQLNGRQLGGKLIAVGTTSCRLLESAANKEGKIVAGERNTDLFIYPGYTFKVTQALLTNFHLPGSSLLMLVSAFSGYELMQEAYAKAIEKRFRFYSYGDAMLII